MIFLVALPLSIGDAVASRAPVVAGLIADGIDQGGAYLDGLREVARCHLDVLGSVSDAAPTHRGVLGMPVTVVATMTAKPESVNAVRTACTQALEAVHQEPGCDLYSLHETNGTFVFVEQWAAAGVRPTRKP